MGMTEVFLTTGALKTGIWIFLLVQGLRLRLMRHYPLAYVYFCCRLAAFWVTTSASFSLGPSHPDYYWIYYGSVIPVDLLALLVLLRIYYLYNPPSLRLDWPLPAALLLLVAQSLVETRSLGYRAAFVLFGCLAVTGLLTVLRNLFSDKLEIGSNLQWLTYGIAVPALVQASNQILTYLGGDFWPYYDAFWVVNELTTVISWGMIAHGMRRYDPPAVPKEKQEAEGAMEHLKELTEELTDSLRRRP